ncbi:MAG: GlxA family transcriptional regulator [Rhodobacteraceae bacterium]|nr:GlxA family transcriptional regulator [Paracoccaceae bacterium]
MDKDEEFTPYHIGLVLIEGFALMSFASLVEPLRAANLLAAQELFRVNCYSLSGKPVASSSGARVPARPLPGGKARDRLAMVIAGGDPFAATDTRLFAWFRNLDRQGVSLGGVSGGPVILANAGLMAGRRMTVHWEHAAALIEMKPELLLEPSLYVMDRDRVTCAGGTAPMDFAHMLIADQGGAGLAQLVSDWFMHTEVRRSEGPQRAGLIERFGTRKPAVLAAIEAMEAHIAEPLSLGQLARTACLGERQLSRLFRRELGIPPMAFCRRLRLGVARNLLQTTSLSLTEIALATGFADSAHFSNAFRHQFDEPPSRVREVKPNYPGAAGAALPGSA